MDSGKRPCVHCGRKFSQKNMVFVKKTIGGWYKRGWFCMRRDKCDTRRTARLPPKMRTALTVDNQYNHLQYKVGNETLSPNKPYYKVRVVFPNGSEATLRVVWETVPITEEKNFISSTSRAYAEVIVGGAAFHIPLEDIVVSSLVPNRAKTLVLLP